MANSDEDVPDYLPNGNISIHGKLARNMSIRQTKGKNGKTVIDVNPNLPSSAEMVKKMNDDIKNTMQGE